MFLHMNWHCHSDRPLITARIEESVYRAIEDYCGKYRGVWFQRAGGTETHVHLVVQVEPTVCPSDFLGKVKGFSSHEVNKRFGYKTLEWQGGYGIETFAKRHLPAMIRYVDRQKTHHAEGITNETLEKWNSEEDG